MKKLLLLSALVLTLCVTSVSAQRIAVGLKAGMVSTQFTTDGISPTFKGIKDDAKNSFLVGAYGRLKLFGDLSLQPELYYAQKKGTVVYEMVDGATVGQDISINTWNIPILAHFSLIDLKLLRVYAVTGPAVSFLTSNTESLLNHDIKDKTSSWGYQLGGGLEVWKLGVDARYEWGLNNVSDGFEGMAFDRKSNMFTLSLTYRIFGL